MTGLPASSYVAANLKEDPVSERIKILALCELWVLAVPEGSAYLQGLLLLLPLARTI